MTKKVTRASREDSLEALRARLLATIRFVESRHDFPSGAVFRAAIQKAVENNDRRMLRLLAKEIDTMATVALPAHEREGLDAMLASELAIDREGERAALRTRVLTALKRGTIVSEVERRHVEEYAELLEATGENPGELELVRRLLASN